MKMNLLQKSIFLLLALGMPLISGAQTLDDIAAKYIQPNSTTNELKKGLAEVDQLCFTNETKCARARGFANYLLSDDYFGATYSILLVDAELALPVFNKANELYSKANEYLPFEELTEMEKNILLESKNRLEASPWYDKIRQQ